MPGGMDVLLGKERADHLTNDGGEGRPPNCSKNRHAFVFGCKPLAFAVVKLLTSTAALTGSTQESEKISFQ